MNTTKLNFLAILYCLLQLICNVHCNSYELVDSWKKINTNYANDIQQSNEIYSKIKEEQSTLAELRIIVEKHLRTKNAERLVNAISAFNTSMNSNNLLELVKEFSANYDKTILYGIFAEAINELVLTSELPTVPDILWSIYQVNDKKFFELMLRAQLQLYNSFGKNHHADGKEFLQNFTHRLYIIKQTPLFSTIDFSLKLKVQNIIEELPENLKYLYFMPYFCLSNVQYSTYIYTAIEAKVDLLSRYIWLWHDRISMDDTGYIKAEIGEMQNTDGNKLNVSLKGIKYQMYYYMMPNTMKVAGWDGNDTPVNYIWNIEFLADDRVVISQNEYLMCAVESHDNHRRNIAGRKKGQVSTINSECQWHLGQCIFK